MLEYRYIWHKKWGNKEKLFQPYLLACQLPKTHWGKTPASVSIVEDKCDKASNNLRVTYNKPAEGEEKKKFAVCVKGLDFPEDDLSTRLTEWIEVLGALGADKIFLYNLEVHPNITKVRWLWIIIIFRSLQKAECTWKHESVNFHECSLRTGTLVRVPDEI